MGEARDSDDDDEMSFGEEDEDSAAESSEEEQLADADTHKDERKTVSVSKSRNRKRTLLWLGMCSHKYRRGGRRQVRVLLRRLQCVDQGPYISKYLVGRAVHLLALRWASTSQARTAS